MAPTVPGRVIAVHGTHFLVETAAGRFGCVTRGKRGGIACGDAVVVRPGDAEQAVIEAVLPRRNLLYRSDRFRAKLFAANVDHVFVVTAAVPSPSLDLINRCLVAADAAGIPASLVVNKIDLPAATELLDRLRPYAGLGYPIIGLAAIGDVEPLRGSLAGCTSILIGASGVGKSTLINALVPAAEIATQEVSAALDSGRHTTTQTRLYHLPAGGALIDSPGMQEFGLHHLTPTDLQATFRDFHPFLGQCRFHNCRHLKEPDCAILAAVADGRIQRQRWTSYRTLCDELTATRY